VLVLSFIMLLHAETTKSPLARRPSCQEGLQTHHEAGTTNVTRTTHY